MCVFDTDVAPATTVGGGDSSGAQCVCARARAYSIHTCIHSEEIIIIFISSSTIIIIIIIIISSSSHMTDDDDDDDDDDNEYRPGSTGTSALLERS